MDEVVADPDVDAPLPVEAGVRVDCGEGTGDG